MKILKILFAFVVFSFVATLWSCNDGGSKLLDQTITKTNLPEIVNSLKSENTMSFDDIALFSNAVGRLSNIKIDTLIGKSVKEVIEMQKEFLKENNFEQLSITTARVAMNMNYEIKYLGLQVVKDTIKGDEGNNILYEIKNRQGQAIKKFSGFLQYFNQQNQLIKQFELDNPEVIPANGSLQFYKVFKHDPAQIRDSLVRYHSNEMIVRWQPQYLEFSDGTKFEIK
jgi:hypothetical protein